MDDYVPFADPKPDFTEEDYTKAIPSCCSLETMQEHVDIMLCWGLAASIRAGKPMDCTGCDLHKEFNGHDARKENER